MADISVQLGPLSLKNPVIAASGTFGYGLEYAEYCPPEKLGAITVKGISPFPWDGNPTPRVAEVYGGLLNSIGLQNPGVKKFIAYLPELVKNKAVVIVNIWGKTVDDYVEVASLLEEKKSLIAAIEINVSCPNIKEGGIAFGTDLKLLSTVVSAIRRATTLPLITKLSPNVGKIANFAKAAVDSGSDILSLINTIPGLSINIETRKPRIANITGGLSGPAIKPIALRMIYETAQAVDAPIIGMGGISSPEDAIEFFLAGADAIAIGTVIFSEPDSPIKIIDGINSYLEGHNIKKLSDIVGKMEL